MQGSVVLCDKLPACFKIGMNEFVTTEVCGLCLSTDRTTSTLQDVSDAYQLLAGVSQEWRCAGVQVCWECRAVLHRLVRFRRQVQRAAQLLDGSTRGTRAVGQCLSRLALRAQQSVDIASQSYWSEFADTKDFKSPLTFDVDIATDLSLAQIKDLESAPVIVPKLETEETEETQEDWTEDTRYEVPVLEEPQPAPPRKRKRERHKRRARATETKCEQAPAVKREVDDDLAEVCTRAWETSAELQKKRAARLKCVKFMSRRHKCLPCALSFHSDKGLRAHDQQLHCQSESAACETCGCRARDAATLRAHRERHLVLRCRRCRFTTLYAKNMRRHAAAHERDNHKQAIACDVCGKRLTNRQHFYIHYKTHTSRQTYECDHCGRVYRTRTQMFRHLRSHRKSFLCHICGKTFSDQTYLNCHSLAHQDASARRFECAVCHKRYINKFKLLVHERFHTGEKPFACAPCDKHFREKAQLTRHNRKYHAEPSEPRKKRTFQRTKSAFVNERFVQSRGESDRDGADAETRERPSKVTETKERREYVCNFCNKKFKDKWRLKFHLAVHSDDRPYKCDECDLTFKYQSGLWTHKLVHRGDKPHQCTICGSQFTQKGNLTAHLKIHTDEKPFQCNICGNKFRMRRNLRNHLKVHANDVCKRALDVSAY